MTKFKKFVLLLVILLIGVIGAWVSSDWQYKSTTYNEAKNWIERNEKVKALNLFEEIRGFRDTDERIKGLYKEMYIFVKEVIKNDSYDNYFLGGYIHKLKENPLYKEEIEELEVIVRIEREKIEADRIEKLKYQEPFVGMPASEIKYSAWGEPDEIDEGNVISDLIEFRWIKRDDFGRIIEIKSLYVKDGEVFIEPSIYEYYQ